MTTPAEGARPVGRHRKTGDVPARAAGPVASVIRAFLRGLKEGLSVGSLAAAPVLETCLIVALLVWLATR